MGTHYSGTPNEVRALDAYIKLYRASESVSGRINEHLADLGLTVSQFGTLEALYHLGPMHQNQIALRILKSTGNITHVIGNLVKHDLVERRRDHDDRRCVTVHLTQKGRKLIHGFFDKHVARVVETFACLTPEEQSELARLCKKLGLGIDI